MDLEDISILLLDNQRSKAYLQNLVKNRLIPSQILLISSPKKPCQMPIFDNYVGFYDPNESITTTLDKHNLHYKTIDATDCNDPNVLTELKKIKPKHVIYCGGGILKKEILSIGKKFIHVHPGIVPKYRGSTCFYYSILTENNCGATAFFMDEKIDTGDILAQKIYQPPKIADLDNIFDPHMRSDLLIQVLKQYVKDRGFEPIKQDSLPGPAETYFIIHPVLKHIAIISCLK